jgi:hypothetical protein
VSNNEQQPDDPSGDGWRDVEVGETLQSDDVLSDGTKWVRTDAAGSRCTWQGVYRRRIEPQQQASDSEPGWRDVTTGSVTQDGDMVRVDGQWCEARPGETVFDGDIVRRRIEPHPQATDDPSGEGSSVDTLPDPPFTPDDQSGPALTWLDVEVGDKLRYGDIFLAFGKWKYAKNIGVTVSEEWKGKYRRIGPHPPQPQASDSEPETMEQLRTRLAECEVLLDEAERSGEQVNAELQQLREQVQTLTRERDRYRNQLAGAIEHSSAAAARQQVLEALQTWLRPVLELVAEHPEDCGPLAVSVLGYLPGIASRLIEE